MDFINGFLVWFWVNIQVLVTLAQEIRIWWLFGEIPLKRYRHLSQEPVFVIFLKRKIYLLLAFLMFLHEDFCYG